MSFPRLEVRHWTDRAARLPAPCVIYRCQENGIGLVAGGTLSQKGYLLGCYAASSGDSLPTFRDDLSVQLPRVKNR